MARILLIDDEGDIRRPIELHLKREGFDVTVCRNGREGLDEFLREDFDLVITDIKMPEMDGTEFLKEIRGRGSRVPVMMLTAFASVESAVEAMKLGADDYICKPPRLDEIAIKARKLIDRGSLAKENTRLRGELDRRFGLEGIVGESDALREQIERLRPLARDRDISVLILGESGTGKELFARAIHQNGPRAGMPFVAVNCAALPENLIESELFGHEKGAFTGASSRKRGLFEAADGGTLFLDEISSMPKETQAKLLRAIEEKEVRPVGGTESKRVDIRLISAANQDLSELVSNGSFRSDLYFRIAVASLEVPPLRNRGGDVRLLARHFLDRFNEAKHREVQFGPGVLSAFERHNWPGNVRELENLVEMLVVTATGDAVTEKDLPATLRASVAAALPEPDNDGGLKAARGKLVADFERKFILDNLEKNRWNVSKTAEDIGLSRPALHSKMNEYGLSRDPSDAPPGE
ncbi:MAG: sigma-54-dependent Fis family transcriptional regulator [Acidobacteriota bacterium]|nr:MAG: sigma-54-dependent Fis family transcriptional regulator [Acidobacteriota bacterium]